MPLLSPGDSFPALPLTPPGGPALTLPDAFGGDFGVMLFFRGAWCPYCNAQLRAFQRAGDSLADAGAKVAALSVDDEPTTAGLIAKHGLTFPSGTAPTPGPSPRSPARSSILAGASCSPLGSSSAQPARSWSACTPAAPSAGSSPRT